MSHKIGRQGFWWVLAAITTLAPLREFFMQELIAAFFIFTVAFAGLAIVLATVFLLGHLVETVAFEIYAYMTPLGATMRRGFQTARAIAFGHLRDLFSSDKWPSGAQLAYEVKPVLARTNGVRRERVGRLRQ